MAVHLEQEVKNLLADKETLKILATTDEKGIAHAVVKGSLHLDEDGNLIYSELLESSQTQKNMTLGIWFNRQVAVLLIGKDGRSYQLKGRPIRAIISGPVFQETYVRVRERLGDVDLASIWIIEPEEVRNQSYFARKEHEEASRPYFKHLDRLAK
ncbi:MAG: pyridoxamine 5'-phosphate oxidase family protein [Firmicutes bacterium]|nr:pyridoxamine 5'-phosphate oxidase family protein [Bacillota bacterium]